jgi:hypothetical protein
MGNYSGLLFGRCGNLGKIMPKRSENRDFMAVGAVVGSPLPDDGKPNK